jgi:GNAT superfamily N-acetyltransferase
MAADLGERVFETVTLPEADVPAGLRKQVLRLHREAWPELHPHGHDPALRPLSMLLLKDGLVVSALDILSKAIQHDGDVYAASGLSAVATDSAHRGRGFGRQLVLAAREEMGRRSTDHGLHL